jgi:hypothetical protein
MSKLDETLNAVEKGASRLQIGCWTIFFHLLFAGFCLWGVYAAIVFNLFMIRAWRRGKYIGESS